MSLVGTTWLLPNDADSASVILDDFKYMDYIISSNGIERIGVWREWNEDYYSYRYAGESVIVLYTSTGWTNQAYRTVTITSEQYDPEGIYESQVRNDFARYGAVEVVSDYLTTKEELSSIANAIRTKGGTSASLVYPAGFVTAIQNIPSGGTDVSDTTATASDVRTGKYFYTAAGVKTQGTIATKSSSDLTASGKTVTVPAGYYASQATKDVATGSATTPATTITANPSISVSNTGLITATNSKSQSVTPTVSAGYVASGTAGTITVSGSNTSQLTTQAAQTITPTTTDQTIASGKYLTGTQTIKGDANLIAANIAKDVTIFGVTGTHEGGGGGGGTVVVEFRYLGGALTLVAPSGSIISDIEGDPMGYTKQYVTAPAESLVVGYMFTSSGGLPPHGTPSATNVGVRLIQQSIGGTRAGSILVYAFDLGNQDGAVET